MSTYTTYSIVGQKEDVSDIITDISPTDTPMVSMIKTQKVSNRIYQYQTDALESAASNKAVEGADASIAALTPTVMISGNTQILTKAFQVSATSDATATYGRAKETAYALGRSLKAIKRDLEFAFVGATNAAVAGNPVAQLLVKWHQLIN
jgi:hypothetical protein